MPPKLGLHSKMKGTLARITKLPRKQLFWLAICLLGLAALEYARQTHPFENPCTLMEHPAPDDTAHIYEWAVGRFQHPSSRHVTLVPLNSEVEPADAINNVCQERLYIAKVVRQLSAQHAGVIVIDKFFGADSCRKDDIGTRELIQSVRQSSSPVVVGVSTHLSSSQDPEVCLARDANMLDFGSKFPLASRTPAARAGLTRLSSDVRRIPLNWYADESEEASSQEAMVPDNRLATLAYTAADLFEKGIRKDKALQRLRRSSTNPFTNFIPRNKMTEANALSLICSGPDRSQADGLDCSGHSVAIPDLSGQVVVIGEESSARDRHELFEQDVSGVYLQANYIESLLSKRYMKPVGWAVDAAVFLLWFTVVQAFFWIEHLTPWESAQCAFGFGTALTLVILLLAYFSGYYVDLGVQGIGIGYLLLRFVDAHAASIMRKKPAHEPTGSAKAAGTNP